MNFITKKHLPGGTFLRGAGVAVALPLLDSMVPAQNGAGRDGRESAAAGLACIYVPHGATMDKWTPAEEGKRLRVHGDSSAAGENTGIAWSW